jgi:Transposase C of IS166 homeodomain
MPFDRESLPRDPDRLIELIIELQERNAHLQGMVDALKRVVYGPRSEKLIADPGQLPLELDDVVLSEKPPAANDDDIDQRRSKPRLDQRQRATSVPCRSTCPAVR